MGGGIKGLRELEEHKELDNVGIGFDITQACQAKCPTCFYVEDPSKPRHIELFMV